MNVFGAIVSVLLSGFFIGALARLAVPGPDPMPFWLTVLIGLGGSIVGGGIAAGIYGGDIVSSSAHVFVTLLLEIAAAALIVVIYRRYVQKRPAFGPDARRFPTRGVGIAQMRERLQRLGVDPDRLTGAPGAPAKPRDMSAKEVADELERLRGLRDEGTITEEEYEQARERLRRY